MPPELLAKMKLAANNLEDKYKIENKRRLNIDPGYISEAKLILATTKNYSQIRLDEARLIWRPCRESTTPYRPLYQIPTSTGFIYVDMDGNIIRKLTPFGLGGGNQQ